MRKKIYDLVKVSDGWIWSTVYDYFMIITITASLIPLVFKENPPVFLLIDKICLVIFIVDFILRELTADYKFNRHHWISFVRYPFRLLSVIDLMAIFALLTSVMGWSLGFAVALKVFRVVRMFRYSKTVRTILDILKKSRRPLIAVGTLAVGYIVISAIIIFNVEPESFNSFFDAIYWATVSLTTVGYGDIYPITTVGRVVAMLSSFFGIAVVALPAGIVSAEYINTLKNKDTSDK